MHRYERPQAPLENTACQAIKSMKLATAIPCCRGDTDMIPVILGARTGRAEEDQKEAEEEDWPGAYGARTRNLCRDRAAL